jgi:hypothetical protein
MLGEALAHGCPPCRQHLLDQLEIYAGLDPQLVRLLGAHDWLEPRELLRAVAGGRS